MEMMNFTENALMIFRRIANSLETLAGNKHEKINWEQRRYEIARDVLATQWIDEEQAVESADSLIKLLKGEEDG